MTGSSPIPCVQLTRPGVDHTATRAMMMGNGWNEGMENEGETKKSDWSARFAPQQQQQQPSHFNRTHLLDVSPLTLSFWVVFALSCRVPPLCFSILMVSLVFVSVLLVSAHFGKEKKPNKSEARRERPGRRPHRATTGHHRRYSSRRRTSE